MHSKRRKTKLIHPILGDIILLFTGSTGLSNGLYGLLPYKLPFSCRGPRISNAPLFISPAINSIAQLQYFGLRMQIYEYFHFDQFTLLLFPPYEPCARLVHVCVIVGHLGGGEIYSLSFYSQLHTFS